MKVVIFGLTITSAWGNGHATTYRSLVKALALRGHHIVFVEKDVEWYRTHRDLPRPGYCSVELYDEWAVNALRLMQLCRDADAVVVGSYFPDAIAAMEAIIEAGVGPLLFYDIDTPITLSGLRKHSKVAYLDSAVISQIDAYLSFAGGPSLHELEQRFGAKKAIAFYCSVDADLYKPVQAHDNFRCDLSYLGTYAADRQPKLMDLLDSPARQLPEQRFIVAGPMYPAETGWASNVVRFSHVGPGEHPSFYSSARFSLNLTRDEMVLAGYSPPVRLFEASACGAAIISDRWSGLEEFFGPGEEILTPSDGREVADILLSLSDREREQMGARARERILAHHTSLHRAVQFEEIIGSLSSNTTTHKAARMTTGTEPVALLPDAPAYIPQ